MNNIDYKKKSVETVLTVSAAFVIIVVGFKYFKNKEFLTWPFFVSGIVVFFGLLIKQVGLLITRVWFKLSQAIGWLSSKIILSVLYFLIITPYAYLIRLFSNRDVLSRKPKESLFVSRNKKYLSSDLTNPW